MKYFVDDLVKAHGKKLQLELIAGHQGVKRKITVPEAHRPGLSLTGFLKNKAGKRIVILGQAEHEFLIQLPLKTRIERIEAILTEETPAVIASKRHIPSEELVTLCKEKSIPLFCSKLTTMELLSKLTLFLGEEFAPTMTCHGTLVEVFGVGVLIQGESSVGKSEAALGLIERGHRLISDDLVRVKKKEGDYLEGYGAELSKHHMEVRGIGIINVAHLYGAVCVRDKKSLDLVVKLEVWDDNHFYDRVGLDEKTTTILDILVPFHVLPVKPGRDVVLLLETIALNYRLKEMGYHSAKEFNEKLLTAIKAKVKKKGERSAQTSAKSTSKK